MRLEEERSVSPRFFSSKTLPRDLMMNNTFFFLMRDITHNIVLLSPPSRQLSSLALH
jgi:hypothetical protein